ncbi:MAG: trehalose-phosphatase [Jatrophihabitans sp.]
MHPDELISALRPLLRGALIATDFDGTLAPLVDDPQASRPVPGAVDALSALAGLGARVAVVTGRDAETVVRLGGLDAVPDIVVAGLYGLESWTAGRLTSLPTPAAIEYLRAALPPVLAAAGADPAVWVEDKRLSLVVHARTAADPPRELRRIQPSIAALAAELGFEIHPGSNVLEVRLPGSDKAGAVSRIVAASPTSAVLYLGDDLGDVPALRAMQVLRDDGTPAWGCAVRSSGVPEVAEVADVVLADPAAVVALLRALAA